jgi:DNA polymerase-1
LLGYDLPVLSLRLGDDFVWDVDTCIDTLIVSKLYNYSRDGHSLEDYGLEFDYPKGKFTDFSKWSQELEDYCARDVEITNRIYLYYNRYIGDPTQLPARQCEHRFQLVANSLSNNGFSFNSTRASNLLAKVEKELAVLDKEIAEAFPPREVLIREFTPRATQYGTINKSSVPKALRDKISEYEVGKIYRWTKMEPFNPSSHKQLVEILNEAGWSPVNKTKTHIEVERELNKLKFNSNRDEALDTRLKELYDGYTRLAVYGWKIDEQNLETLPPGAPSPARALAKRILYEARRRTLVEWLALVQADGRIHGKFYAIGAWTHRMAHQNPNTANIPNEYDTQGKKKLLGKEMRSLWCAPKNRLLVGCDAEGIQLRIFAHLIDDPEFTRALVEGKKEDKSDPHSLNARILGSVCPGRQAAKRFIYALLLGAGIGKLAEILGSSKHEAESALERLMGRYGGFTYLKKHIIPADAQRGWFVGLDGRNVRIPGETVSQRKHLCMSGYLQAGEAVVMKAATLKWGNKLKEDQALLVNMVHDEWQTETPNNMEVAIRVAEAQARSLREVGEELKLKCPLAGSYWNDDHKDYTIGTNWSVTH